MTSIHALEKHATLQRTLLGLLESSERMFDRHQYHDKDKIRTLKEKVMDDQLRVVVLGSFKRGKSTLINAMLGMEILPNFATPCTAVINEIKYGEEKKAVVHFRDDLDEKTFELLPSKAKDHFKNGFDKNPPPLTVGIDEIVDYVVITNPEMGHLQSTAETPYDHVEIFWPLPILKNGVVIIDSPGLDECDSRTRITERYLTKADAILFVQSCTALAGQSEMEFIDNLLINNGYEDTLFICNRFDEIREKERERIIEYGRQKLGEKTNFGPEGVVFLSGGSALEGRVKNDQALVDQSGIVELERRLYHMLVSSRGKTKLIQPTRSLSQELAKLSGIVHTGRSDAREKTQDLQYRLKEYRRLLEREVLQIHKTLTKLQNDLLEIIHNTRATVEMSFFNHIYPNIGYEYGGYQPTAIGMSYFFSEKDVRRKRILDVARQIKWKIEAIFKKHQKEMDIWLQNDLTFPNESAEDYISHAVERIVDSLDRLQTILKSDESSGSQVAFDVGTLKLDKLPKLSDAKAFVPTRHKQNIVKSLQSVGIDGNNLHGRSLGSFFSIALVDYYKVLDEPNIDRLLQEGGFPDDDPNKDTNDLKAAIGQFFDGRVEARKDALFGPHTLFWDSSITSFIENLHQRIDNRLEQLNSKAAELGWELSALQKTHSESESCLKEIYGARTSLEDLTYDLAVL